MKKSKLLKFLGFFIVIVPFSGVACHKNNSTSLPTNNRTPKYILAGTMDSIDGDFVYYSINDGTEYAVALKEAAKANTGEKTIPSEYNSKPVTGIWRSAFYESKYTKVNIPSSITVIDYEAFLGSKITSVTIPASVSEIGEGAFYSCKNMAKAAIQNSSTTSEASSACSCSEVIDGGGGERTYSTLKKIPSFCFFNCVGLKELVLPESIEEIEYEAFNGCSSLFSTLAFMNIKTIRSRAFQNCKALKNVYISNSFFKKDENQVPIGVIEEHAFNGCSSSLQFHLVGETATVESWLSLSRNLNCWNVINEFNNPALASNQFEYEITTSGASYSNDWIYTTTGANNDVEITSYIGPTEIEGVPVKFLSIPNELPSGSGHYVRNIALNALDTVKASLERIYLPTSLRRIGNGFFNSAFTNLTVIDDNTTCSADEVIVQGGSSLRPRIILNGITSLTVIGSKAFLELPSLINIEKLYLPYSLEAVGSYAFGRGTGGNTDIKKHLQKVTDFRWDYDDNLSALKVIGREAFFEIGRSATNNDITNGTVHQDYLSKTGNENYQLTTLVFPRTFKHFGVNSSDATQYELNITDTENSSAFAGSPLLSKVVFKGSKKSTVQNATSSTNDNKTSNLVLGYNTFAMDTSLRTVVFEERCGKYIVFHTEGNYKPVIGWSSGKSKNDFGGNPALQTLVLPDKYTNLRIGNYAFQGNSRGAIYLSGSYTTGNSSKILGITTNAAYTSYINSPNTGSGDIASESVNQWRAIGDEGKYNNVYPGYNFQGEETKNKYGVDQKMPIYDNILYKDTINVPGINTEVEVGTGNTKEYIVKDKCSFVTGITSGKATMTNYLYDRYDSTFTGTARVPATVTDSQSNTFSVNEIGASAFSADYCDTNSYKNDTLHKDLIAIEIPDTIAKIGEYAFTRAYGVTKVSAYNVSTNELIGDSVMPSSLTEIGKHGFAFCNIVSVLNIPNGCQFYENLNATVYETSVFSNNFSLRRITFGNDSTSSDYYETTTYTHTGSSDTYTSALYSKNNVSNNSSSLLLVLNRDSTDYLQTSADLSDDTVTVGVQTMHYSKFDGQHTTNFLYGAFKMCYWLDSLIVGSAINDTYNQPLISGLNEEIYLNQPYNFTKVHPNLKSISFGSAGILATPPYAFEGCTNIAMIELPRVPGATIPAGLFASIANEHIVFKVPSDDTGEHFKVCDEGVLDLEHTGYAGIAAEAFKETSIKDIIAPNTTDFTIGVDAFANCTSLRSINFSKVTGSVNLNASFRGATLASTMFNFGSQALIRFGDETFKGAKFTDHTFVFPEKTAIIGDSCFESCDVEDNELTTVTAAADLTYLERVASDNGAGKNNEPVDGVENNGGYFKQIGNYAFYMCEHLTNFDFSHFTQLERIGHYAFSMYNKTNGDNVIDYPDKYIPPFNYTATITSDGVIDLPDSLTNLGIGAFNRCAISEVKIDSTHFKFERGNIYTTSWRAQITKGCHTFRFCPYLTKVVFTQPNCKFDNFIYLTKGQNDQTNFFSNCDSLVYVLLPTGYNIQYFGNGTGNNERPDSMIWGSNSNTKVYVHHTTSSLTGTRFVSEFWRRTADKKIAPVVYYVANNSDLATNSSGSWAFYLDGKEYWTYKNNQVFYLGTATIDSSTGIVTFKQGNTVIATANSSGITFS